MYTDRETIFGSNLILRWGLPLYGARALCSGPGPSVGGHPVFPGSCEGSSNDRTFLSLRATATGYQIDAHPTSLLVVQYGRLCALCLHEATSWIPPAAAGKAPNLSCFVVFTHAILLILILCLFACSIGYIHDERQAGAEQASPHNNIVMSCLFNAGKKILGGFAIWKLIFSLVSSLIILATLRPCQIMPLTVRSYIR